MHNFDTGFEELGGLSIPIQDSDHLFGDPEAAIRIVEYGDFECPFCRQAYWKMRNFHHEAEDNLCFSFRQFPLSESHPHAEHAAEASEIAGKAGKFWEMHDMLFENQDALDDRSLAGYAVEIGLDGDRFIRELASHSQAKRVRADFMSGVRSGVNGTPSFFVNEVHFNGTVDELVDTIAEAIEES